MSFTAVIVGGAALAGSIYSSSQAGDAAQDASNAQTNASNAGIAQQKDQFDQVQKLLAPYANAGTGALSKQQDLLGLNGNTAQTSAIGAIQNSPAFAALQSAGNNNILANASATGGLRGGNTQAALAQFSPALLNQLINQQYSQLGGLTSIGQNAAAGTGNAGMSTGNNITSLLGGIGQAQAGSDLAQGKANIGLSNGIVSGIGTLAGGGYNGFGGSPSSAGTPSDLFARYTGTGNYTPGGTVTNDGYANYFGG